MYFRTAQPYWAFGGRHFRFEQELMHVQTIAIFAFYELNIGALCGARWNADGALEEYYEKNDRMKRQPDILNTTYHKNRKYSLYH